MKGANEMVSKKYRKVVSFWLSLIMVFSVFTSYIPVVSADSPERYIHFEYERPDGDYDGWNLWVWGTGAQDDQIDFTRFENGKAIAKINVGNQADQVGFIVRKGNWEEKDPDADRNIKLLKNDLVTKVYVTSGQLEFHTVPEVSAPEMVDGVAQFYFRDKTLYNNFQMDTIEKVELSITGERYEMTYEPQNERFSLYLENLEPGTYEYTYFVTIDGQTKEIADPYNTKNGKSVLAFVVANIDVTATAFPEKVNYNENVVISVDLHNEDDVEIRELFVDATNIGGHEKVSIDPLLNELTLAVDYRTTAGTKTLPITVVDEYGKRHQGEVTFEVAARTSIGGADFAWDEAIIYFLLTDRFFDGDTTNNDPYGLNYDTSLPGAYQGGDFKGITKKLDYLDDLGINTIWINPIVENVKYDVRFNTTPHVTPYFGYHGYWASNFEELNPHFGTMEDFHELIDEAHARGMKIMIDVVLNHTGYGLKMVDGELAIENRPPGYPTDEEREFFKDMLRQGTNVGNHTVRGELAGLPDFITEDPAVRDQIVKWQVDWIEKSRTPNGNTIDYFRVDTVKHVEDTTWMKFKNEMTKVMPEFKMIGESWGAHFRDDHGYLNTGTMDSLLDFEFKNYARNFVNGQLDQVHNLLVERNNTLTNGATLGQFLGSHDEDGFLHRVNGDKGKLKVAASLLITAKGQPVIYYGEELGITGEANYPHYTNRPNMPWEKVENNDVFDHYKEIISFRNQHSEVFARGDRTQIAGSNTEKYHLFGRSFENKTVFVGLNVDEQEKQVTVNVSSDDVVVIDHYSGAEYTAENGKVTFTIPAMADGGTVLLTTENGTILGTEKTLRVHYQRTDNDYSNLGLWLWGDVVSPSTDWPNGTPFESELTDYGAYVDILLTPNAREIGLIVLDITNGNKDGDNKEVQLTTGTTDIWLKQGTDEVFFKNPDIEEGIPENTLRVHYQRTDGNYTNLGLWTWFDVANPSGNWPTGGTPFVEGQTTDYGVYVDLPLNAGAEKVGFLVLNVTNGDKDGGDKVVELFSPAINEVWIKQGSDEVFLWEPVELPENTVRIHYERQDGNYDGWAVWNWGDVVAPSEGWSTGATDAVGVGKFGAYYDISLNENAQEIGFLFVNKNSGQQTRDYKFELLSQYKEIFMKDGDDSIYTNPFGAIPVALISGEILSDKKIGLVFSKTEGLDVEQLKNELTIQDKEGENVPFTQVKIRDEKWVDVYGEFDLDKAPFTITYGERTVFAKAGWRLIDEMFGYDGELGARLHADGTATLKLWSPKADVVSVVLYDKDDQDKVVKELPMVLGDRGVWSITLTKENTGLDNLRGFFYHYEITHGEETKLALDPYANSMAAWVYNNRVTDQNKVGKAAIVDPSTIGPELDFAQIPGFEKREDAIIYEVHVRDFTSDPSIGAELKAQFGTFASFVEKLDYIEALGVTHVQLLPVMSYYFGDELNNAERMLEYASTQTNYNWGYDPHSYFSLSGMYSENPNDPELRIKEFKNLVNEIHKRGMGVVLDVVYNHTARVHIFEDLVPNYYHFMDADGTPRTSFGGGRLGTTHKMARRILVDSILHWVNEYKVDGFRFDMMGDHDAESIQIAFDKAKAINPNIVMIGEGWRTFVGDEGDPVQAADQDWMQYTEAVGSFSDEFRNELKSGFGSEGQPRFITNGARNVRQIFDNIKAQPHNFVADQPGDVVPYIEAHDNLTLYDVIAQSIRKDPEIPENNLEIHKRIRIGNAMVLTAQGTAFIHAGQEFGRTKQFRDEAYRYEEGKQLPPAPYKSTFMVDQNGKPFVFPYFIHDSYDSSDIINKFDWNKATNAELFPINNVTRDYTTGLIALRRSTDAFRLGSKDLIDQNVTLVEVPEIRNQDLAIVYRSEATNGDAYYTFINADNKERTFSLNVDLTNGVVLVDNDEAGTTPVTNPSGFTLTQDKIVMDALTTVVIKVAKEEVKQPTPPANPVTPTPNPGDTIIVNNPQAENGKITVPIAKETKRVLLPVQAAAIDGKNSLEVKGETFSAKIPAAVLNQLKELAKGKQDGKISFTFVPVEKGSTQTLLNKKAGNANVEVAGDVYNLSLAVVDKDGKETKLSSFSQPITITLAVSETANKKLANVYKLEEDGTIKYVGGKVKDGKITVSLTSFSKYAVLEINKDFSDVKSTHWAHNVIKEMAAKQIVTGISDVSFAPERNVTRAEFAALIVRALKLEATSSATTFADVPQDKWFASAVMAANEAGIVNGRTKTVFAPDDTITREEMVAMIVRAYEYVNGTVPKNDQTVVFTDLVNASQWSHDYIIKAAQLSLVNGRGNNLFSPRGLTTRAESVQVIANLYKLVN